jgi:hypothetical protein
VNTYWRGLLLFIRALSIANHFASFKKSDTNNMYVLPSIYKLSVYSSRALSSNIWLVLSFVLHSMSYLQFLFFFDVSFFFVLMETLLYISRKHNVKLQYNNLQSHTYHLHWIYEARWQVRKRTKSVSCSQLLYLCKLLLAIRTVETFLYLEILINLTWRRCTQREQN